MTFKKQMDIKYCLIYQNDMLRCPLFPKLSIYAIISQSAYNLGPLSTHQRNAIEWRFAGGPRVARFYMLMPRSHIHGFDAGLATDTILNHPWQSVLVRIFPYCIRNYT